MQIESMYINQTSHIIDLNKFILTGMWREPALGLGCRERTAQKYTFIILKENQMKVMFF